MSRCLAVIAVLATACSDETTDEPTERPVGGCNGLLRQVPGEEGIHQPAGTAIEWSTNPPLTGEHYPAWAGWDRSYTSLDRGTYLHNMEHGGVILLYNCPEDGGCPDIVAQLVEVARAAPVDDTCTTPITKRVIIAPDPLLPSEVKVAASAWNVGYTASCVDPYLTTFLRTRFRHGPEDTCADGVPFQGVRISDLP